MPAINRKYPNEAAMSFAIGVYETSLGHIRDLLENTSNPDLIRDLKIWAETADNVIDRREGVTRLEPLEDRNIMPAVRTTLVAGDQGAH